MSGKGPPFDERKLSGKSRAADNLRNKARRVRKSSVSGSDRSALMSATGRTYVPPAQRVLASPEHIQSIRSIHCFNLPPHMDSKDSVRQYFQQFGKVTKCLVNVLKNTATVYFGNHEMAVNAKQNGANGMPENFKIFWSQSQPGSAKGSVREGATERRILKLSPDDEVQKELQAMAGQEYNINPDRASVASSSGRRGVPKQRNLPTNLDTFLKSRAGTSQPSTSGLTRAKSSATSTERVGRLATSTLDSFLKPKASTSSQEGGFSFAKPKLSSSSAELFTKSKAPRAPVESTVVSSSQFDDVLRKPAFSTEERVKALDARDKLLRLRRVRQSDLASAQSMKGTCPDMCPEKERYLREDRHQVAMYEQVKGQQSVMDHSLAVKQYSRSSADQEEPLPHELRPPPVLRATMNHLLAHVASRCDIPGEGLGDWYFYLWDRTRAIRKDITQQELCDSDAVTLVEQCARFHIVCAARLADQDLTVFDPKINTENLAKCLQTLKHLYHDMAKRQISCPNEPEFRGYVSLLNLNTGDVEWEVQQLSAELRSSPQVQFAVQLYLALSRNNYIRFFKMVRSGGYLFGCILMRYFTQVRSKALETIVRAYCPTNKSTNFPLSDLQRQLAFEDFEDATQFCEYHGLDVPSESVTLSRTNFHRPDTAFPISRALLLVESQRQGSVAEVIAGCRLADFSSLPSTPHSSFDDRGYLRMGTKEGEDVPATKSQPNPFVSTPKLTANPFAASSAAVVSTSVTNNPFAAPVSSLFAPSSPSKNPFASPSTSLFPSAPIAFGPKAITFPTSSVSSPITFPPSVRPMGYQASTDQPIAFPPAPTAAPSMDAQKMQQMNQLGQKMFSNVLKEVVSEEVLPVAKQMARDWKVALKTKEVARKCLLEVVSQVAREACAEEVLAVKMEREAREKALEALKLKQQRIEMQAKRIANVLLDGVCKDQCKEMMQEAVHKEVQLQEHLHKMAQTTSQKCLLSTVEQEVNLAVEEILEEHRRKRAAILKKAVDHMQNYRTRRALRRWHTAAQRVHRHRDRVMAFPAGRSTFSPAQQAEQLRVHATPQNYAMPVLRITPVMKPQSTQCFPLLAMDKLADTVTRSQRPIPMFLLEEPEQAPPLWRATLSLPEGQPSLLTWAHQCTSRNAFPSSGGVSVHTTPQLCMRLETVVGPPVEKVPSPHGVVLLVLGSRQIEAGPRLGEVLTKRISAPLHPTPVAVFLLDPEGRKSSVDNGLKAELQRLGEMGYLGETKLYRADLEPQSETELQDALEWLGKQCPSLDPLVVTPLSTVLLSLLGPGVWSTSLQGLLPSHQMPAVLRRLDRSPCHLIRLSNCILDAVVQQCSSCMTHLDQEEMARLICACPSLPPYYTHLVYQQHLSKVLPGLKLSELNKDYVQGWPNLSSALERVCQGVVSDAKAAGNLVSWVIQQIVAYTNASGFNGCTPSDAIAELPWPQLVKSIMEGAVQNRSLTDPFSVTRRPLLVVMGRAQLASFLSSNWCLEMREVRKIAGELSSDLLDDTSPIRDAITPVRDADSPPITDQPSASSLRGHCFDLKMKSSSKEVLEVSRKMADFLKKLEEAKERSKKLDKDFVELMRNANISMEI